MWNSSVYIIIHSISLLSLYQVFPCFLKSVLVVLFTEGRGLYLVSTFHHSTDSGPRVLRDSDLRPSPMVLYYKTTHFPWSSRGSLCPVPGPSVKLPSSTPPREGLVLFFDFFLFDRAVYRGSLYQNLSSRIKVVLRYHLVQRSTGSLS